MSTETDAVAATGVSQADAPPLLAYVDDLSLYFDTKRGVVKALDGVSFELYQGEILALVGETGCGKTITARSFMQLVPTPPGRYPSGRVMMRSTRDCEECGGAGCPACHDTGLAFEDLLAKRQRDMKEYRGKRIAMIFQDPKTALNPALTIKEQVAESILVHQADDVLAEAGVDLESMDEVSQFLLRNETSTERSLVRSLLASVPPLRKHAKAIRGVIRERVIDVLRQTQIPNPREVVDDYPHELSGGQQQRVMIAMALVAKPDLLIADEATTALDVTTQARILELIKELQEEIDMSLLYITHDLNLVSEFVDRVAVMYAGSIAEVGSVAQVYEDPKHPYTIGLINSIPSEARLGMRLQGIPGSIPDLTNPPEGCRFCTRCPDVLDHCCDVDPEVVEVGDDRYVACHLYPEDGEAAADGGG